MDDSTIITKIKQEKISPERELARENQDEVETKLDKILESNLFGGDDESDSKKNIEPTK